MCGRFVLKHPVDEIALLFSIDHSIHKLKELSPNFNVSPTQNSLILSFEKNQKLLSEMHFGLIPSWSKDASYSSNLINARVETITDKPNYRSLIYTNRCIVLASGYFEWRKEGNAKQPYFIHLNNNSIMTLAGLWTEWNNIRSFTIITTQAADKIKDIHHRMPLIIDIDQVNRYLNPRGNFFHNSYKNNNIKLEHYKVSRFVNKPINNSIRCIDQLD